MQSDSDVASAAACGFRCSGQSLFASIDKYVTGAPLVSVIIFNRRQKIYLNELNSFLFILKNPWVDVSPNGSHLVCLSRRDKLFGEFSY